MRALAFLLGSRAIELSQTRSVRHPGPEPDLPALASTPERARAWRAWARADRRDRVEVPATAVARGTNAPGGRTSANRAAV